MTFAQWEKKIRLFDEFVVIHTETDSSGAVIRAWTATDSWTRNAQS